jgi:secretory phospholipase A2
MLILSFLQIIKCATGCNPQSFNGYGCFCGYLGSGEPVDGIDT